MMLFPPKKVAFYTLGCKLNFAESSALAQSFEEAGYTIVDFEQTADLYVINTCTVTGEAEKKCRRVIQKAHRLQPKSQIAVVGCFSALRADEIQKMEGVSYVFGAENKTELLSKVLSEEKVFNAQPNPADNTPFIPLYSSLGRTRSFFKIQDGCDNFCTYCAIPYARGRSRSCTIEAAVKKAQEIADLGFKEVVFTGVNIGDFGRKNGENFHQLLQSLIPIKGIERWRISSIEPELLSSDLITLVAKEAKLMPHFHLPLQAGSDTILNQMKRHYNTAFFAHKVAEIKQQLPHAFIAADVIVGFPTETPELFEETYHFIEHLPLSALHVFPYSSRPEAKASTFPNLCSKAEKDDRSQRLHLLSDQKKQAFYKNFSHQSACVLWESEKVGTQMLGYTNHYLRVSAPYQEDLINTISRVTLEKPYRSPNKDWIIPAQKVEK